MSNIINKLKHKLNLILKNKTFFRQVKKRKTTSPSLLVKFKTILPKEKPYLLISALITLLILAPAAYLLTKKPKQTEAAWFNDSWLYRKRVPITNSGSNTSNQYVKIPFDTASLIAADKMQSDCHDLRVTNHQGKLLPHFIDGDSAYTCNDSDTAIYVMADSLPSTGNNLYLYYGNSNAPNVEPRLGTNEHPAISCRNILEHASDSSGDGQYYITPTGNMADKIEVTCDMTTDSGGWIKVYEGLSTSATATSRTTGNTVEISSDHMVFDQMRITAKNWTYSQTRTTTETALMQLTFSGYYEWLHAQPNTPNPDIKFHSAADGIQDVQFTSLGEMMMGYGNSWRRILSRYYTQSHDSSMYLGGLSGTGIVYTDWDADPYNTHMNDTSPAESGLGLTPFEFQEIYTWIRENNITLISNISIGSPASEEQSPGPIAHWKFDEGYGTVANDSTQNKSHGTITGATWASEDQCINGKCLSFNGTDNRVDTNTKLSNITSEITVSSWVYPVNPPDVVGRIIASTYDWDATPSLQRGWTLGVNYGSSDVMQMTVYDSSGVSSGSTLNNFFANYKNQWVHVVGVYKSGQYVRIYINGQLATENTSSIISAIAPGTVFNLRLGTRADTTGQAMWDGKMDDVKIYPYARSAAQIKADYASRGSTKGTSVSIGGQDQNESLSQGLIGYWKMDETSTPSVDSSGNDNNGTWTGSPTYSAGKYGNSLSFNGSSSYIGLDNPPNPANHVTVTAWFKRNGVPDGAYHIIFTQSTQIELSIPDSTGAIRAGVTTVTDGRQVFNSGSGLTDNNWHFLSLTYDGTSLKAFIDGVQTDSNPVSGALSTNGATRIGNLVDTYYTNGDIDEVRIYNRALSPTEIRKLYNWAPGPVGYWKMDEGVGTSTNDSSGNSNTGTLTNSPTWTQGKFGKALQFTDKSDYVSFGNPPNLNFGTTNNFTVGFWAKTDNTSNKFPIYHGYATNSGYFFYGRTFGITDGTNYSTSASSTEWRDNKWHYITGTVDRSNNTISYYIDGILSTTASISGAGNIDSTIDFKLSGYGGLYDWDGSIDDVRIYNYARTPGQIIEDMNSGHPLGGSPISSKLAWYKFDVGYGETANNSGFGGSTISAAFGASTAAPSWTNTAKIGKALLFTAANNTYIRTPITDENGLNIRGEITYSAWFKRNTNTGYQTLIDMLDSCNSNGDGFYLRFTNQTLYFRGIIDEVSGIDPFALSYTNSSSTGDTTNWHHVVVTWDGTTNTNGVKMYIDGIQVNQTTAAADASNMETLDGHNLTIGSLMCNTHSFDGYIDEVKIYNTVLTKDEVLLDYNQGSTIVLGSLSTASDGTTSDSSAARSYCVPGDTATCDPPIAEWKMDEKTGSTIYDTSNNSHNSSSFNGTPTWTQGKNGAGLNFEADDNDWVIIPDHNDLDMPTNDFTTCLWINPETTGSQYDSPLDHREDSDTQLGYQFRWGSSNEMEFITDYGASSVMSKGTAISTNTWYHFCAAVDRSGSQYLYQDGSLIDSDSISSYSAIDISHTDNLLIGSTGSTSYDFDGKIDQVVLYDYFRTPAQIAWEYNRGKPVGHWKLDECQGLTAYDSSDNANHGIITIGGTGDNTSAGTCSSGTDTEAWNNGTTGKRNASLHFDGTDDYVDITSSAFDVGTGDFSIALWAKVAVADTNDRLFSVGGAYHYELWVISSGLARAMGGDSSSSRIYADSNSSIEDNTWHHIVAVYDRDYAIKLYIDGALQDDVETGFTAYSAVNYNITTGRIGGYVSGISYSPEAQIDDVKFFNYALTEQQIKTDYNLSAIFFGPLTGSL